MAEYDTDAEMEYILYIFKTGSKPGYLVINLVDIICIIVSYFLAFFFRHKSFDIRADGQMVIYWQILFVSLLSYLCIAYMFDLDSNLYRRGYLKEFKAVLKSNILLLIMFSVYMFISQQSGFSRLVYLYFLLMNTLSMYFFRVLLKWLTQRYYKNTRAAKNILLVTTSEHALSLIKSIEVDHTVDYRLKGIVIMDEDMKGTKLRNIPVVTNKDEMYEYATKAVVDEVLINLPHEEKKMRRIAETFIDMGVAVHINVECVPVDAPSKAVHILGNLTVITGSLKVRTQTQAIIKRSMDILGGIVGVIFTGLLTVIIAPLIYLESPGPVFFTQTRVGRNGRYFKIYKFRSMYLDAEEKKQSLMSQNKIKGNMFKIDDDPRITRIGKFIRKTSIDEFPQFWNVLKGDMSLVGTRPPTVDEYENYEGRHKKRLAIQPGLTGIWQVSGRSNIDDFEKVVELDEEYISNWSLGLDCRLILKTVGVLLGDRNAY